MKGKPKNLDATNHWCRRELRSRRRFRGIADVRIWPHSRSPVDEHRRTDTGATTPAEESGRSGHEIPVGGIASADSPATRLCTSLLRRSASCQTDFNRVLAVSRFTNSAPKSWIRGLSAPDMSRAVMSAFSNEWRRADAGGDTVKWEHFVGENRSRNNDTR